MRVKFRNIVLAALVLILAFGTFACGDSPEGKGSGKVEIWTQQSTEKILQDYKYEADYKSGKTLEFFAYKNDYESAQLFMTPENDVKSYALALSDLALEGDSSVKLTKSNFTVYNQKYIEVTSNTRDKQDYGPLGFYPDALLPFEVAAEYGENKIKSGENQGIWVELYVPESQRAGVYKGSFTLTIDGTQVTVPVEATVWDYSISVESHTKTDMGLYHTWGERIGIVNGEKDSSFAMMRKYVDYLMEYRLMPRDLPCLPEDTDTWIELAVEYTLNEKCSHFDVAFVYASEYDSTIKADDYCPDYDLYRKTLQAMAERSISYFEKTGEKCNLFSKASTYFVMLDEAVLNKIVYRANRVFNKIFQLQDALEEEWRSNLVCSDAEYKEEIIAGMQSMVHKFVDEYTDQLNAPRATYVPLINQYDTESSRERYYAHDQGEKWWYTCVNPQSPYPTLHIDDPQQALSTRIMSWMQYDYDIVGNLYWTSTYFGREYMDEGVRVRDALEDYYSTPARYPAANGDGYLLYPGAPYGIDGPVGSVRLHHWRDGLEEYEIMYALGEIYNKVNPENGIKEVLNYLYRNLYFGTKVSTDSETFLEMRKTLAQMMIMANKTGVLIFDAVSSPDKADFKIFVPTGATASVGGTALTDGTAVTGGTVYSVNITLTTAKSYLALEAEKDGSKYALNMYVGEKIPVYGAEIYKDKTTVSDGSIELVDAPAGLGYDGKVLKLAFAAATQQQQVTMGADSMKDWNAVSRVTIRVYVEKATSLTIMIKGSKQAFVDIASGQQLSAGWNDIHINAAGINWAITGTLENVRLKFGSSSGGSAQTVYIGETMLRG